MQMAGQASIRLMQISVPIAISIITMARLSGDWNHQVSYLVRGQVMLNFMMH